VFRAWPDLLCLRFHLGFDGESNHPPANYVSACVRSLSHPPASFALRSLIDPETTIDEKQGRVQSAARRDASSSRALGALRTRARRNATLGMDIELKREEQRNIVRISS